jgi:hypothetical protein
MSETQVTTLQQSANTPAQLLSQAIEKGMGVAELEKLVALQERWEANQARKAFFEAFTAFQAECPDLRKTKAVKFKETDPKPQYMYATLGDITRQLRDLLKRHQLSYRWEITSTKEEIKVVCLVSHIEGHTERTEMTSAPDPSGSKNGIQARGSAVQYLKRYTLEGALGLSTTESDIDGKQPDDTSVDDLHNEYMREYNQLILLDNSLASKYNPDNWKGERNAVNYKKAIGDIRKKLFDLQQKAK